jgi:hypothetical protein
MTNLGQDINMTLVFAVSRFHLGNVYIRTFNTLDPIAVIYEQYVPLLFI